MIDVLGRIVGFRSGESAEHVRHVNQLTARLLDRLTEISGAYRLTQADCVTISTASALHDVGKTGVDQGILNKPGRLTPEEFEAVKQHTVIGEELLRGMREYRGRAAAGDGGGDLPLAPRAVRRRRLSRRAEGGRHPHLGAGGIAGRCVRRAGAAGGYTRTPTRRSRPWR